ncbi:MAG TPA: ATP-binding SpoIIE family protein phosphatase [Alphaproteobacteria bacterium]|nr:ATP-binding SpoIIE family protein phosphatase [Alphaproteobacteria bacterium]
MMHALAVQESTAVAEARRRAQALALDLGWKDTDAGRVALVVSELGSNLHKHAGEGTLIWGQAVPGCLDVLALDRGRGIPDLAASLRDGYSTAGTAGTGLGAVGRLADRFDIYTQPGQGTVAAARLWPAGKPPAAGRVRIGAVQIAMPGEEQCGDGWFFAHRERGALLMLADGLGHGPLAADAAHAAIAACRAHPERGATQLLDDIHHALRSTRGAAVAVAELDIAARRLVFAGLGNILGTICDGGGARRTVSHNGIAGHQMRRIQEFSYALDEGAVLVLQSDGLATSWNPAAHPGLWSRDPAVIAGVLYRDHCRGRDDATVVVVRGIQGEGGPP